MKIKAKLRGIDYVFETKPGLFSKDKIDAGSKLLIEHLEIKNGDRVIDLGCGYGTIGIVVSTLTPKGTVYMTDVDVRAIKYSQINAQLNQIKNVTIIASDGFEAVPKNLMFDVVVSNPPSHMPKETLIDFVSGSKKHLVEGGKLYFVNERRLKPLIKRLFEDYFENYESVFSNSQYVVSVAQNSTLLRHTPSPTPQHIPQ